MKLVRIIRELPLDDEVCWCRVSALTPGIEGAGPARRARPVVPRSEWGCTASRWLITGIARWATSS